MTSETRVTISKILNNVPVKDDASELICGIAINRIFEKHKSKIIG
jgi:hypothetical protein